ncbi:phage tail tube protein [Culicoidibacter larvae]|nr:phage tail tube protein [Culicoidibacter larvae]
MKMNLQFFAAKKSIVEDTVSAKEGSVTFTRNGKRYTVATVTKFEAKIEFTKTQIPQLGRVIVANKATGAKLTGSLTMHFHDPYMVQIVQEFIEQGHQPSFDVTVNNADMASTSGRLSVLYENVLPDSIDLSRLDATAEETLERNIDFTADGMRIIEIFKDRTVEG